MKIERPAGRAGQAAGLLQTFARIDMVDLVFIMQMVYPSAMVRVLGNTAVRHKNVRAWRVS